MVNVEHSELRSLGETPVLCGPSPRSQCLSDEKNSITVATSEARRSRRGELARKLKWTHRRVPSRALRIASDTGQAATAAIWVEIQG